MISWAWAVIAFVLGEAAGFVCAAICSGSTDKEEERKWAEKNGLLYAEDKKETADAGTSTAARETGRKDYFL